MLSYFSVWFTFYLNLAENRYVFFVTAPWYYEYYEYYEY
jgi:hypothetical protein